MALKALRTPMRTLRREIWNAANRRPRFWLSVVATLGVAAALSLMLWGLSDPLARFQLHAGNFRLWILSFGALAPLIYTGAFSLQILLAPVPGNFMGLMGGYLFGAALGTLYSVAGLTLGAGLAMLIARRFGRPLLERFGPARLAHWEKTAGALARHLVADLLPGSGPGFLRRGPHQRAAAPLARRRPDRSRPIAVPGEFLRLVDDPAISRMADGAVDAGCRDGAAHLLATTPHSPPFPPHRAPRTPLDAPPATLTCVRPAHRG